jgi:hypothetical protein
MTVWWDAQTAGLIGGVVGGGLGALGGVFGAVAGTLSPKGLLRRTVLTIHAGFVVIGAGALAAGLYAIIEGQPYHVFYPLLLIGLVLCAVMGPLFFVVRMRYRWADQRRLDAEDLRRS